MRMDVLVKELREKHKETKSEKKTKNRKNVQEFAIMIDSSLSWVPRRNYLGMLRQASSVPVTYQYLESCTFTIHFSCNWNLFCYSQENAVVEWKFSRTRMWLEWIDKGNAVPVPFNILHYFLCILCCIWCNTCRRKEVRHEALMWGFYWVTHAQVMGYNKFEELLQTLPNSIVVSRKNI